MRAGELPQKITPFLFLLLLMSFVFIEGMAEDNEKAKARKRKWFAKRYADPAFRVAEAERKAAWYEETEVRLKKRLAKRQEKKGGLQK